MKRIIGFENSNSSIKGVSNLKSIYLVDRASWLPCGAGFFLCKKKKGRVALIGRKMYIGARILINSPCDGHVVGTRIYQKSLSLAKWRRVFRHPGKYSSERLVHHTICHCSWCEKLYSQAL